MRRWISTGLVVLLAAVVCVSVSPTVGRSGLGAQPSRPTHLRLGGRRRHRSVARMVGILLEKELGQPVTVVNRTGGSGAVGHTAGATAAPDGHTSPS